MTAASRKEEAEQRLPIRRKPETDMEVCTSFQLLEQFAEGSGVWSNFPARTPRTDRPHGGTCRRTLSDLPLVPVRWPHDVRCPYTIFGPQRAAVYIGQMFFVFNSTEHIRVLARHFDNLIREAVVQPNECGRFIRALAEKAT